MHELRDDIHELDLTMHDIQDKSHDIDLTMHEQSDKSQDIDLTMDTKSTDPKQTVPPTEREKLTIERWHDSSEKLTFDQTAPKTPQKHSPYSRDPYIKSIQQSLDRMNDKLYTPRVNKKGLPLTTKTIRKLEAILKQMDINEKQAHENVVTDTKNESPRPPIRSFD
jgi:hypothetical protein